MCQDKGESRTQNGDKLRPFYQTGQLTWQQQQQKEVKKQARVTREEWNKQKITCNFPASVGNQFYGSSMLWRANKAAQAQTHTLTRTRMKQNSSEVILLRICCICKVASGILTTRQGAWVSAGIGGGYMYVIAVVASTVAVAVATWCGTRGPAHMKVLTRNIINAWLTWHEKSKSTRGASKDAEQKWKKLRKKGVDEYGLEGWTRA